LKGLADILMSWNWIALARFGYFSSRRRISVLLGIDAGAMP
jgi:hypothetical protein